MSASLALETGFFFFFTPFPFFCYYFLISCFLLFHFIRW